ncbi:MAG: exodeoxyribonuclease VII small subunit [Lachnospiraceae bacterium]|nr:exodeoxyribonuclease VII small subunit [Lachnospiraceae bacterium]
MSLEDNFARLEETIAVLEKEDVSLEESFAAYLRGMQILKQCSEQIDKVEKQVLKISEDGTLEEF